MGSLTQVLAAFRSKKEWAVLADAMEHAIYGLQSQTGMMPASLRQLATVAYVDTEIVAATSGTSSSAGTDPGKFQARASLSSTLPFTSAVISSTKCYLHPRWGNQVSTWNGSAWAENSLTAVLSASVPAITGNSFDLTMHKSGTALKLTTTAWTNSTTRATPVKVQNGAYILSGTAKRLVASGYVSASGHCVMSETKLNFVNVYNRMPYKLKIIDVTNSWVSTNTSLHAWHSGTVNRCHYMVPLPNEYMLTADFLAAAGGTAGGSEIGIGLDSSTVNSADLRLCKNDTSGNRLWMNAKYLAYQPVGKHFLQPLELGVGAGTTFYGDDSGGSQSGLLATVEG